MASHTRSHSTSKKRTDKSDPLSSWKAFDSLFDEAFGPTDRLSTVQSETATQGVPSSVLDASWTSTTQDKSFNDGERRLRKSTTTTERKVVEKPPVPGPGNVAPVPAPMPAPSSPLRSQPQLRPSANAAASRSPLQPQAQLHPHSQPPVPTPLANSQYPKPPNVTSQKYTFREIRDSEVITMIFSLPNVAKEAMSVAYYGDHLNVSWEIVSLKNKTEGDRIIEERKEQKHTKTLPLPPATKFEEIRAVLEDDCLTVSWPNRRRSSHRSGHSRGDSKGESSSRRPPASEKHSSTAKQREHNSTG